MTQQQNTARPMPIVDRPKRLQLNEISDEVTLRLARAQRQAREHLGLQQKEVAAECGLDKGTYSRCELVSDATTINLRHIVMLARAPLTRTFAIRMHQWLEGEVAPAADVHGENDAARLASLTVETSDPVRALAVAMADGALTVGELETLERECCEAITVLQEARARFGALLAAKRERA